ncbi:MAG: macro domain-containing protein, partial [Spirochaetia bacterium]|nr:macro domain-containing protein [Spirochaetia bacterium]
NCIHTFAGIQLRLECHNRMEELRSIHGPSYQQPTSIPMLTDAYNLPARKVIHVVGPIVSGSLSEEHEKALADCYTNVLDMCLENSLRSVAFCCISTGVFHFPNQRAAEIATATVRSWLSAHPDAMDRVILNVFKDKDKEYYERFI